MIVQSVCGEHMSCFCKGIDIPTKCNKYVLHRQIKHEFVVVFIHSDVDLMDFCRFTLGTILWEIT